MWLSEWLPSWAGALGHLDELWVRVDVTDPGGLTWWSSRSLFSSFLPADELNSVTSMSSGAWLLRQALKVHSKLTESSSDSDSVLFSCAITAVIYRVLEKLKQTNKGDKVSLETLHTIRPNNQYTKTGNPVYCIIKSAKWQLSRNLRVLNKNLVLLSAS